MKVNGKGKKLNVEPIQKDYSILNKACIKSFLIELLNEINNMILMEVIFVTNLILETIILKNLPLI